MSDLECFLADTVFELHEFPNHDFWHANSLRAAKKHHTHSAHIHACLAPGPDTPFDCKCTSASAALVALLASRPHTHMLILSHHPCRVPPSSHFSTLAELVLAHITLAYGSYSRAAAPGVAGWYPGAP